MWRNDILCKYMFMFLLKNVAHKGLMLFMTHGCFFTYLYEINLRSMSQDLGDIESTLHDDVIKWKHFPRYWPFVWGIHRSPVNSLHKGQWRGAVMFSLIFAWINGWVSNHEAGDLRCHHAHYDVIVMAYCPQSQAINAWTNFTKFTNSW